MNKNINCNGKCIKNDKHVILTSLVAKQISGINSVTNEELEQPEPTEEEALRIIEESRVHECDSGSCEQPM